MYVKSYKSQEFLNISDDLINEQIENIKKFLFQYEPNTLLKKSLEFNCIISDVSNTIFDFRFGKDEDEYYEIGVLTKEFKKLFYKKYSKLHHRNVDRIYNGLKILDITLQIDVNWLGLFSEIFGWENYNHTLPELALFSWYLRPSSDSIPFIINRYCKGNDNVEDKDYQVVLVNLCLMFLCPLASLYNHKISSELDSDNEVQITYDDSGNKVFFSIKNHYSGLDPSGIGNVYGTKPLRILPNELYNIKNLQIPDNPSFFSISEFETTIDNQINGFSEFIDNIDDIPLDTIKRYANFIINRIGNNPYKRYSTYKKLLKDTIKECEINKKIAKKLIDISLTNETDALNSFFIQKPILKSGYDYFLIQFSVPRWTLLLLDAYAEPSRSYQITMGYRFENEVKTLMNAYDLQIIDIKRIDDKSKSKYKNREFDVLVDFGNEIYDFQCKNYKFNFFPEPTKISDLKKEHNSVLKRVISGLEKEVEKKEVLEKKYNKKAIFYAISRFPIITNNPKIIPFNQLDNWLEKKTGKKKDLFKI